MRTTDEMIKNEILWGGLCTGTAGREDEKEADIVVFGIPFDGNVSYREGAKDAPAAIRESTIPIPPTTEYFEDMSGNKVADIGDFSGDDFETVYNDVEEKVSDLVKQKKFFTMIGGDHSVTIPVLSGINKVIDHEFGVIHIDAHFDLCDELNGSRLSHGCTQRRAIEMENVGKSENIFFIGIRSVETDELK